MAVLERHGELRLDTTTRGQLLQISASTIDRKLAPFRDGRGPTTTKPGSLLRESIPFTRCRPYRKNDQAHVEQKNWSVVRQTIGYQRYESEHAWALLDAIYADLRLYGNFFQPVMKLTSRTRRGSKVHKTYDLAKTPHQRVMSDVTGKMLFRWTGQRYPGMFEPGQLRTLQRRVREWRLRLTLKPLGSGVNTTHRNPQSEDL